MKLPQLSYHSMKQKVKAKGLKGQDYQIEGLFKKALENGPNSQETINYIINNLSKKNLNKWKSILLDWYFSQLWSQKLHYILLMKENNVPENIIQEVTKNIVEGKIEKAIKTIKEQKNISTPDTKILMEEIEKIYQHIGYKFAVPKNKILQVIPVRQQKSEVLESIKLEEIGLKEEEENYKIISNKEGQFKQKQKQAWNKIAALEKEKRDLKKEINSLETKCQNYERQIKALNLQKNSLTEANKKLAAEVENQKKVAKDTKKSMENKLKVQKQRMEAQRQAQARAKEELNKKLQSNQQKASQQSQQAFKEMKKYQEQIKQLQKINISSLKKQQDLLVNQKSLKRHLEDNEEKLTKMENSICKVLKEKLNLINIQTFNQAIEALQNLQYSPQSSKKKSDLFSLSSLSEGEGEDVNWIENLLMDYMEKKKFTSRFTVRTALPNFEIYLKDKNILMFCLTESGATFCIFISALPVKSADTYPAVIFSSKNQIRFPVPSKKAPIGIKSSAVNENGDLILGNHELIMSKNLKVIIQQSPRSYYDKFDKEKLFKIQSNASQFQIQSIEVYKLITE